MLNHQGMNKLHSLIYAGNFFAWLILIPGFSIEHIVAALAFAAMTFIPCIILAGGVMYFLDDRFENCDSDYFHFAGLLPASNQRKLMDKF